MEIQCPHCASRFNLPEHLARPGAKLRCSVCKTVFALHREQRTATPEERTVLEAYTGFGALKCILSPANTMEDIARWNKSELELFPLVMELHRTIRDNTTSESHERPLTPVQGTAATAENIALLTMKDVRQYYVNNEKMGKILVIEGRVVNEFPQPVSMITVEAVLYGQDQKVIASNRQTAGNQLTPLQLSVLDKEAMASRLADPEKEQGANVTLLPGASAPFMVVFDSPPNDVSEFYVAIVDAQKGVPLPR